MKIFICVVLYIVGGMITCIAAVYLEHRNLLEMNLDEENLALCGIVWPGAVSFFLLGWLAIVLAYIVDLIFIKTPNLFITSLEKKKKVNKPRKKERKNILKEYVNIMGINEEEE